MKINIEVPAGEDEAVRLRPVRAATVPAPDRSRPGPTCGPDRAGQGRPGPLGEQELPEPTRTGPSRPAGPRPPPGTRPRDQPAHGPLVAEPERRPHDRARRRPQMTVQRLGQHREPGLCSIDRHTMAASRPPVVSTLAISTRVAARSGTYWSPSWQQTTSKLGSPNGRRSASACTQPVGAPWPGRPAATASMPGLRSRPTTCPSGPTRSAASRATTPCRRPRPAPARPRPGPRAPGPAVPTAGRSPGRAGARRPRRRCPSPASARRPFRRLDPGQPRSAR
jgi:hypothetical protein